MTDAKESDNDAARRFAGRVIELESQLTASKEEIARLRGEPCYQFALTLPPGRSFTEFGGDISGRLYALKIERDDAKAEIERMRQDGEPSNEQTIGMFNNLLTAANAKVEKLENGIRRCLEYHYQLLPASAEMALSSLLSGPGDTSKQEQAPTEAKDGE